MVMEAARRAFARMMSAEFRSAFFKALGLTLLLLAALWFGLRGIFTNFILPWAQAFLPAMPEWTGVLGLFAGIMAGIALALALAFLIAPITAIVAGLFLDDVAETVERNDYPHEPVGTSVPPLRAFILAAKFFALVLFANFLALLLLFVPVVNLFAFFIVNGYLLGREFFEFAAMRYRSEEDAKALRQRHSGTVLMAGLLIAAWLAIPIVNLAAPIFAAAMMVHLHKMISAREKPR